MTSRPLDWSPLGLAEDPTPGDPDAVAELALRFRRTADAIRTASEGLTRIQSTYVGKGGEKLRERTRDLAAKVEEVHERYAGAADALDSYHPEQYAAQRLADDALRRAVEARHQASSASWTLSRIPPRPTNGTTESVSVTMARSRAQQAQRDAAGALARAQADARQARDWQWEAGSRAAGMLRGVIAHDGLTDSMWENIKGDIKTVGRHLRALAMVMDEIAMWASLLALALFWIPGLGEALALVALFATVVGFAANLLSLVTGQGSLSDTIWDGIGLLTFGVGRVAETSGRVAVNATRVRVFDLGMGRGGYRKARTLLGGPLGRGIRSDEALAAREGFLSTGFRSLKPNALRNDFWQDVQNARKATASRTWLTAREWWRDTGRPWAFDPLKALDSSMRKEKNVAPFMSAAENFRALSIGSHVVDGAILTSDVIQEGWGRLPEFKAALGRWAQLQLQEQPGHAMPNLGLLWQTIDPAASQDAAANQNRGETGETLVRS